MIKNRFLILFAFMVCLCPIGASNRVTDVLAKRFGSLSQAYKNLRSQHTEANEKMFVASFPQTWYEYMQLDFACQNNLLGKDIDCSSLCDELGNLTMVNDTSYCALLVNLARGAVYDADAANYFKSVLHKRMGCVLYPTEKECRMDTLLLEMVSGLLPGDQFRFWAFYWSSLDHEEDGGNHPDEHEVEYNRIAEILVAQYPRMLPVCQDAWRYYSRNVMFQSYRYDEDYLLYYAK